VHKKRFHFRSFWPKFACFAKMVRRAWHCPLHDANPFQCLDCLLRNTVRTLTSWSTCSIGSVCVQLALAREVLHQREVARDHRSLAAHEEDVCCTMKLKTLGLSSLQWTIAQQESHILWLSEGDMPTKFFHVHASAWSRSKFIYSLNHDSCVLLEEADKAVVTFNFFNEVPGTLAIWQHAINMEALQLPKLDLTVLVDCFMEVDVLYVIKSLPPDKAPGSDGFTARFLRSTWSIIQVDLMEAFDAFWRLDTQNFHNINEALLVLLPKSPEASSLKNYRPISLIHLLGKLFSKVLSNRLAPKLASLIHPTHSAFIKGRCIQDNFKVVQAMTRMLHARKVPSLLLKGDISRAFDSVAWPFLLEVMHHVGFTQSWLNWVSVLLSMTSTRVLLNDNPGERICHARGTPYH
jgi:hypothetical protein